MGYRTGITSGLCMQWYNGRLRPEEVAQMVTNGCLDRNVPNELRRVIRPFGIEHPTDFTAYDEGSPRSSLILSIALSRIQ